jgi:exodeoxyribonuclease-3
MRIISWNVNGVRAVTKKNSRGDQLQVGEINCICDLNARYNPDVLVLQETKTNSLKDFEPFRGDFPHISATFAEKKGYSGVAVLSKVAPVEVIEGFRAGELGGGYADAANAAAFGREGRLLTAVFAGSVVVGAYVPNSKTGLLRIEERGQWELAMLAHLAWAKGTYPDKVLVYCGDLNVAHQEIDLCNPRANMKAAGFSPQERGWFGGLLASGMIDTFRHLNPTTVKYSWWSPITKARQRNAGWRIDYCLVDSAHMANIITAEILNDVFGSDHCPVFVEVSE